MIVDSHTHVFSPRVIARRADYARRDPCFSALYARTEAKLATAEDLIASMDKHGVDRAVICNIGWASHELCVESNDYILESIARYPGRLAGLAAVQPSAGGAALRELERCVQAGVKGVGEMRPDVQGFDMANDNLMTPLANYLNAHNLVWLTHAAEPVGHVYPGKGGLTPGALYPFIQRYPNLNLVLAHWGGGLPFYALMPEVRTALQNCYFDSAASPFLYEADINRVDIDIVWRERVLFGSDYPLMGQGRPLSEIRALPLDEATRAHLLGGNAARLFGLLAGEG
jgi:predicted TIM-barrel fold metal-dependent hydrolase